jgi:hypothetical protein
LLPSTLEKSQDDDIELKNLKQQVINKTRPKIDEV